MRDRMNLDETRLKEIQVFLKAYHTILDNTESITESLNIQSKIDALETEQNEILRRCKVEI